MQNRRQRMEESLLKKRGCRDKRGTNCNKKNRILSRQMQRNEDRKVGEWDRNKKPKATDELKEGENKT